MTGHPFAPDPWLAAQAPLLRCLPPGPVLDLACGNGRNALWIAGIGRNVLGLDRDRDRLGQGAARARQLGLPARFAAWDLEAADPPPGPWAAVLLFHYLDRDRFPRLPDLLAPGGLIVAKTHLGHALRPPGSRPRRPAYLLRSGELPRLFPGTRALAYAEWADRRGAYAGLVARRYSS